MAQAEFILQGFSAQTHFAAIQRVLSVHSLSKAIFSVAFLNFGGVALLKPLMSQHAAKIRIYAGIRNPITSVQALTEIVQSGVSLVTVDTGAGHLLFHPKIYYARGSIEARLLIGSANITAGGLNNNIEGSVLLSIDLGNGKDKAFADGIEIAFNTAENDHPKHMKPVADTKQLENLLRMGLLVDEATNARPRPSGKGANPKGDALPLISLTVPFLKPPAPPKQPTGKSASPQAVVATAPSTLVHPPTLSAGDWEEVWESNGLSRRDLSIPTGANTSLTGSMLFKKGRLGPGIDYQHYFRDSVFDKLKWKNDSSPNKTHLERTVATFNIVIKSIDYGDHELALTHNTKAATTLAQKNALTQVHWGSFSANIRRPDLLGRTLRLYRDRASSSRFGIEID